VLEERYVTLQRKNQITDQNMLEKSKKVNVEIKAMNEEIREIKTDISKIRDTVVLIISELRDCARKPDVDVIEKYLQLWQPVNFVTQTQVEKIVNDILDARQQK
jgi:hypothetical protein